MKNHPPLDESPSVLNKRTDGVPPGAVYVGRPTKWGNPFSHLPSKTATYVVETREEAVIRYREWLLEQPELLSQLSELEGKDLVCWCAPLPCHAVVLVDMANRTHRKEGNRMKPENVLIIDVETNGFEPDEHEVIEVGCILYNVENRTMVEVYSSLMRAKHNEAEEVNGIPEGFVQKIRTKPKDVWETVAALAEEASAYVAHNAQFDQSFCEAHVPELPWVCTIEDFIWPKESNSRSLLATALAQGVGVVAAHRAINDCLTMALCFDRIEDFQKRMKVAYEHAKLPKATMIAKVSYNDRQLAKDHDFKWEPDEKKWKRYMAIEDAKKLPFPTVQARS